MKDSLVKGLITVGILTIIPLGIALIDHGVKSAAKNFSNIKKLKNEEVTIIEGKYEILEVVKEG